MKSFFNLLGLILLAGCLHSQNGYFIKFRQITNKLVTDTLLISYQDGNTLNQLTHTTVGKTTYKNMKLKANPAVSYVLYPDNSYRTIPDVQVKDYTVTVMGKEQFNGYNCTKISVQTFLNGNISYLWITDEIAEYKNFTDISIVDLKLERINDALKKQGVSGFPVKIAYKVPNYITYEFVNVQATTQNPDVYDISKYTNAKPVSETK